MPATSSTKESDKSKRSTPQRSGRSDGAGSASVRSSGWGEWSEWKWYPKRGYYTRYKKHKDGRERIERGQSAGQPQAGGGEDDVDDDDDDESEDNAMSLTDPTAPQTPQTASNVIVSSDKQEIVSPVATLEAPNYVVEPGTQNLSQNRTTSVQDNRSTPAPLPIPYSQPRGPSFNSVLHEGQIRDQGNPQSPPANVAPIDTLNMYPLQSGSGHSANYFPNFHAAGTTFGNTPSPQYVEQYSRSFEHSIQPSNQTQHRNYMNSSQYSQAISSNTQGRSTFQMVRANQYTSTTNQYIRYSNQENESPPYRNLAQPTGDASYQHQRPTPVVVNRRDEQSSASRFDAHRSRERPPLVFDATGLHDDPHTSSPARYQPASSSQAADRYDYDVGSTRALTQSNLRDQSSAHPDFMFEDLNPTEDHSADDFNDNDSTLTITEGVRNMNLKSGHPYQKSSSHGHQSRHRSKPKRHHSEKTDKAEVKSSKKTNSFQNKPSLNPDRIGPQTTAPTKQGDARNSTQLHSEYQVCHSKKFVRGRVFKMLWTEPQGQGGSSSTVDTNSYVETEAKYGEKAYHSIRRFIIVRVMEGHSLCVPIMTYGRRATTKPGVKPEYHAIIFTGDRQPPLLPGEPTLGKLPIRMNPYNNTEQLVPESRINYAKLFTVEHDYKVCFIGEIDSHSEGRFFTDYARIQEQN